MHSTNGKNCGQIYSGTICTQFSKKGNRHNALVVQIVIPVFIARRRTAMFISQT